MDTKNSQLIEMITEAIVGVLALYNFVAPYFNLPALVIGTEQITAIVTGLVMLGLLVWAAWKNHNVTPESKLSQLVLNGLKDGIVAPEMVTDMLDEAEKEFNESMDELNAEIEQEVIEFMDKQDQIDEQDAIDKQEIQEEAKENDDKENEDLDLRVNKGVE